MGDVGINLIGYFTDNKCSDYQFHIYIWIYLILYTIKM